MAKGLIIRLAGCAVWLMATPSSAEIIEVGPSDDVEGAMNALQPGDELVLQGGMYTLTDAWHLSIIGTEQMPITIHAKAGEVPHLNRPAADQNVLDFDSAQYVVFSGIEVSGGSHGIRLIDVDFMTIENCEIHDTGDVALSANSGGEYQGLILRHNHIHDTNYTGEGMYLGCNSDACRMFDSLIEGNYIHHTNGPTIEQGDGIEIKEGSYNNIVRDNVIHDTGYPCILTYSTVGNGGPNIIERNVMWNCGDHAIQSAADAIIRNNIILGSNVYGIAMQQHQAGSPSNLVVAHNTILHADSNAIAASGITGSVQIVNNAVYAPNASAISLGGNMAQVIVAGNVGIGSGPGSGYDGSGNLQMDFVAANLNGAPPNDVFPAAGSKLNGTGDAAYVTNDDFNGTLRAGVADVGAYKFDANGNPGWTIAAGFKDEVPDNTGGGGAGGSPTSSGGSPTSSGGATSGPGSGSGGANGADGDGSSSGCGCRTAAAESTGALALLLAACTMLWRSRARRR